VAYPLEATAADWRWASATKAGDRTSGTQIWTGLSPWARRRSRWRWTRSRAGGLSRRLTSQCYM
jgi:hypothetical protein